jgi:putative flippase GtrA
MANFGGNERIIATVAGIVIAFVTIFILQLIVKRDTHTEMGTAA